MATKKTGKMMTDKEFWDYARKIDAQGKKAVGERGTRTKFNGDQLFSVSVSDDKNAAARAMNNRRETNEKTKRKDLGSGKALASEMKFAKASNSQRETYRRSPYEIDRVNKLVQKDYTNSERERRQGVAEAAKKKASTAKKSTSTAKSTKTATAKKTSAKKTGTKKK